MEEEDLESVTLITTRFMVMDTVTAVDGTILTLVVHITGAMILSTIIPGTPRSLLI